MTDLISIIVPVYNVEKYLDKCINSIVSQTYKNLEIVLVDDESHDNCPEICDKWSEKDKRIKVIHKKNGGVSSARNEGLKNATGSIIGFVDSDDYVEPDMIMNLYNNYVKFGADISVCSYNDEYLNGKIKPGKRFNEKIKVIEKKEAIENLILEQNISNHLWNKIYNRNLFEGIFFPDGKKMEDLSIMYLLFEKSNRIVIDNYVGYHYLQHNGSIMGNINRELIGNYEQAVFKRNGYLLEKYPEFESVLNVDNLKTYKLLHYYAMIGGYDDLLHSDKFKHYYKKYKECYPKYRKQIGKTIERKVLLSYDLFWISKKMYYLYLKTK